jgi:hypothetical protein
MPDPFAESPLGKTPLGGSPYNPEPGREKIRGYVTIAATIVFGLVVIFFLIAALAAPSNDAWSRVKEAMQSVLPAVTSVLGTVLGFYFGSQKR